MERNVKHIFACCSGDPSVGIPSASFECEINFITNEERELKEVRERFRDFVESITGEPASVQFDFEIKEPAFPECEGG